MFQENPREISWEKVPSPIDWVVGDAGNSINNILGSESFSFDYEGRMFSFSQISSLGKDTYRIDFSMQSKKDIRNFSVVFSLKDEKVEISKLEKNGQRESLFLGEEILFWDESIQSFIEYFTSTKYWQYLRWKRREEIPEKRHETNLSTGVALSFLRTDCSFTESSATIRYRLGNTEYEVTCKYNIETKSNRLWEKTVILEIESMAIPKRNSLKWASYKFTGELQAILELMVRDPNINPILKQKMDEVM